MLLLNFLIKNISATSVFLLCFSLYKIYPVSTNQIRGVEIICGLWPQCSVQTNFLNFVDVLWFLFSDVFAIIPETELNYMLYTFNNYHLRLKFTHEMEMNNSLNFLNVSIIRDDRNLKNNWFRKLTFSGRYINYFSSYPNAYKINTITNLVDQAILLSNKRFHKQNIKIVKDLLLNNCFPKKFINKHIKRTK